MGPVGVRWGHASLCHGQVSKVVSVKRLVAVKWDKGTVSPQTSVKASSVVKHQYGVVTCQMSGIVLARSSTTKWRNGTGSKLMSVQVQTWPVKNVTML